MYNYSPDPSTKNIARLLHNIGHRLFKHTQKHYELLLQPTMPHLNEICNIVDQALFSVFRFS